MTARQPDGCPEYQEITRRGLLSSLGALATNWIPQVNYTEDTVPQRPSSSTSPRDIIITIFLRGGADGFALCPPWKENSYATYRNGTRVDPPTGTKPFRRVIDLDGFFGFTPAMAPLQRLFQSKYLLVAHQTGSLNTTRSHFDAQQFLEAGHDDKQLWTGWLGRHIASVSALNSNAVLRAVALSGQMPLTLEAAPLAASITDMINFSLSGDSNTIGKRLDWLQQAYASADPALKNASVNARKTIDVLQKVNFANYQPAAGVIYNPPAVSTLQSGATVTTAMPWYVTNFGTSLSAAAAILKASVGVEAIHIDFGGWDSHNYESLFEYRDNSGNPAFDTMFWNMRSLAANLDAFFRDLDSFTTSDGKTLMQHVTIVVETEFGRTVNENGNQGTDHGQGGVMMFLGRNVNGGRVDRVWQPLATTGIDQYGGLAVSLDYRIFLGELLEKRLQNGNQLGTVFPGYQKPKSGWRSAFI